MELVTEAALEALVKSIESEKMEENSESELNVGVSSVSGTRPLASLAQRNSAVMP